MLKKQAIVLAAGKSSRFNTGRSKQLAKICGQSMILYSLKLLEAQGFEIEAVLGFQADEILDEVKNAKIKNFNHVIQKERLGTGHAVACTKGLWEAEDLLILNGDAPLITEEIIAQFYDEHKKNNYTLSICSSFVLDPSGYGRIIEENDTVKIVEEKDCNDNERAINKINAGIYIVKRKFLEKYINEIEKSSKTNEFYITTLVEIASQHIEPIFVYNVAYDYVRGVDTLEDLWAVEQIKRSDLIKNWMSKGVRFDLAQTVHLDIDIKIEQGATIAAGVHLLNGSKIGKNTVVGPYSIIDNSEIGDNSDILPHTVARDSKIGSNVSVGPFAYLRNNSILCDKTTVGCFVEIKKSSIETGSKAKHLSFIGDATVGKNVNIGAGTITANYDGIKKHQTIIEDNVFVGSNTVLIAPISIGSDSYTAAGSTLNKNVPSEDLAIARARQENKTGYAKKLKAKKEEAVASSKINNLATEQLIKTQFIGAIKTGPEEEIL